MEGLRVVDIAWSLGIDGGVVKAVRSRKSGDVLIYTT